tara:strand:- start:4639 stop:5220 length:582 start_codon:yes stop_codon:yes gene_type:complete
MRLDWDDENLIIALRGLGWDGPAFAKALIKKILTEEMLRVKKKLKKKVKYDVRVPPWGPSGESKDIYLRVAEALRVEEVRGATFVRVHAAGDEGDHKQGIQGSRGGFIASIVARGRKSTGYPSDLPGMVRSSTKYYTHVGRAGDIAWFRLKRHPGFKDTLDFMKEIEQGATRRWKTEPDELLKFLKKYGFQEV